MSKIKQVKVGDIVTFTKSFTHEFYPRPIEEQGKVVKVFTATSGKTAVEIVYFSYANFKNGKFIATGIAHKKCLLSNCSPKRFDLDDFPEWIKTLTEEQEVTT